MNRSTQQRIAILLVGASLFAAGCGTKKEDAGSSTGGRTTSTTTTGSTVAPHDDAGTAPHSHDTTTASVTVTTPAASDVKTYTFHGTTKKIDEARGMITIDHEKIGDFMEAMEMPFKVADPALLKKVAVGKNTHFTLTVAGTDMLITKVEDEHAAGAGH